MKKSEMIKKMVHDTFNELQGEDIRTAEFPYKVAELMLEVCEKAGMRPPFSPKAKTPISHIGSYDWEPEE